MMFPLWFLEWLTSIRLWRRPDYLLQDVDDTPSDAELRSGIVHRELREGHPKWAHFACPRCKEHISLPIVGRKAWSLSVDLLRRPTLHPSIWQTGSCGAHFFVRRGKLIWCRD